MSIYSESALRDHALPTNHLVGPLLTDFYQITMVYAYWKADRADDHSVFELFFRKCPFQGEFCLFAGLDEILKFIESYHFSDSDITYLKSVMTYADPSFWPWLQALNCENVKVFSVLQGEVVFPKEPLLRLEGPLAIVQLLETTLLNLVNFPSLVATNAMRMKIAASSINKPIELLEFGLRRAQGPDGAISASKYAYLGGFSATSNVLAGKLSNIPIRGTHAHAFVMSFRTREDLKSTKLINPKGVEVEFFEVVLAKRKLLGYDDLNNSTNYGELLAFISYAQSNPSGFIALVDTYDTIKSGVPNFLSVGLALHEIGYKPIGIRLDSGDLSYLSIEARKLFLSADKKSGEKVFEHCKIIASNDIDEKIILSLNLEGHEIDVMAVGTKLATCYSQPALGCVYKLVEVNGKPRIKLSQESEKVVIPSKKSVYRLIGKDNIPIVDIMLLETEPPPEPNVRILCRHPFHENKRAYVTPSKVVPILHLVWNGKEGIVPGQPSLDESRNLCWERIQSMRTDHIRTSNPTPYKVSLSESLYTFFHELIQTETPIADLS